MGHVPMPGDDDWQPPTLVEKQKDPLERALDDVCSVRRPPVGVALVCLVVRLYVQLL